MLPNHHVKRTPELEREIDYFVASHPMSRYSAWTFYIRPLELERLRAEARQAAVSPSLLVAGPVTCPHCAGLRGKCCQCGGAGRVRFTETLCTWIWAYPGCEDCRACLALRSVMERDA